MIYLETAVNKEIDDLTNHYFDSIMEELKHEKVVERFIKKLEFCIIKTDKRIHFTIWDKKGEVYADIQFQGLIINELIKATIKIYIHHAIYKEAV